MSDLKRMKWTSGRPNVVLFSPPYRLTRSFGTFAPTGHWLVWVREGAEEKRIGHRKSLRAAKECARSHRDAEQAKREARHE